MGEIKIHCLRVGMLATNCYLVHNEETKEALIIDPGDNAPFIEKCADDLQIRPVAVLLTHAHGDHILALPEIREKYQIPFYVHREDVELLADRSRNMGNITITPQEGDVLLEGGEELTLAGIPIRVIHTPGHTKGGVCYYLEENGVLFSGDTMFRYSWGRTDFPGGSEKEIMDSIHNKLLVLPEETQVFPGHESATTIGIERKVHQFDD